jgi:large subunit ribosomal protein L15
MSLIKKPKGATRPSKRLGRGPASGVGGTSGKGENGQNSRSGGGVRPGFEGGQMPLYRRIAHRGFSNYPFKLDSVAVNLRDLDRVFKAGEEVSYETLVSKKLIKASAGYVKILGSGELTKALTVRDLDISAAAAEKVKSAGGKVISAQDEVNGK